MSVIDYVIIALYFVGILGAGHLIGRSNKSNDDYFAGGRSMPWYALGLSVGLTMISANSFIGGPGWAYDIGFVAAMVNITIPITILFITYTILPVIYNAKVTTVYEYVNLRLGSLSRVLMVISWLAQSIVFIGGFVYTPALVLSAITGISQTIWVPIIVVVAILLTIIGGIKAVVWTDAVQGVILFVGILIATFIAIGMLDMPLSEAVEMARSEGRMESFLVTSSLSDLNIWSAFLGGFAMWVGYFGFDQGQVQRYVSAKNMVHIKKTGIMSSISMQLIYWACFFLGVVFFVFYQTNEPTLDFGNTNNVMTDFLLNHIPSGLLGVLLSATFAAAISSIDSVLNSLTAVFVKDIYEPFISKKEGTSLTKSRIFTGIFGIVVVAFVYLGLSDNTSSILEVVGVYVAPFGALLTGVMFVCCFFPKANDKGTFIGSIVTVVLFFLMTTYLPAHHYLWGYLYGAVMTVVFSCFFSIFFKNEEEANRKYKYTVQGTIKELNGRVEEGTGCSLAPLKLDKYAYIMIAVFVVHSIILFVLQ